MAKKKETLKDLSEFMKNQPKDGKKEEDFMDQKPTMLADVEKLKSDVDKLNELPSGSLHEKEIVTLIQKIANTAQISNRQVLFNIIESVLEGQSEKDHIDLLLENHISFLKYHQLVIDKLNS